MTIQELNSLHQRFWAGHALLLDQSQSEPLVIERTVEILHSASQIILPVKYRKSFEQALAEAKAEQACKNVALRTEKELEQTSQNEKFEEKRQIAADRGKAKKALTDWAKSGGFAPKSDALNLVIRDLVAAKPDLALSELIWALKKREGDGTIISVDRHSDVRFHNESTATQENIKRAKARGLKDRLYRAKKNIIAQAS